MLNGFDIEMTEDTVYAYLAGFYNALITVHVPKKTAVKVTTSFADALASRLDFTVDVKKVMY